MNVGIVGHEAAKFTRLGEAEAKRIITELLLPEDAVLVSGHCPLGGVDIWAEEIADQLGRAKIIHPPKANNWEGGFKPRNLLIARDSEVCHCIVVNVLPPSYRGRRFPVCYHCRSYDHVKSGGCWTARKAKAAKWHIVEQGTK